jgi:CRP-like cAMP-binding protein
MARQNSKKLRYLSEHELFQDFSPQEMKQMERQTTMFTCKPGRTLYNAGETGEVLFILKEGSVHLYRLTPEGRKLIVATLGPGSIFGEMGLIGQRMYDTFAVAATPARVCVMSRIDMMKMMLQKPKVALRMLNIMGRRLIGAERQLEQMAFSSVPSRLATRLLELRDEKNQIRGHTHQELADMIGTYRETVTATLNDFKSQGLIEIGRKRVNILDRDGLEEFANIYE